MPSNRRTAIKSMLASSAALATGHTVLSSFSEKQNETNQLKGNITQSVCQWVYNDIPLDDFCEDCKKIGLTAIDLVGPKDWNILKKHGIYSSMCNGAELGLYNGFNNKQYHAALTKNYTEHINLVADAGYKQLICFSGARKGLDDETGMNNCIEGLKPLLSLAEKKGVILVMELLNSRIDHKDYMCDKSAWGVELCKRIGSDNFKLLFDIYHMQIDEGDIIRTIRDNHQYFSHYHTGGVPGRNEIDNTQELYYPAVMKAIVNTGFKGYVAQEFVPSIKDKLASLRACVQICDV